ncbi:MAG: extensin family protein [Pseudolabrys sp.]
MRRGGIAFGVVSLGVLVALAGCGRGYMQFGERESWRHEAEISCLKSGEVKVGSGVVKMSPIEGPGMCGADFPLKVAALGEASVAMGYGDEIRPPGSIPNAGSQMPQWPINQPRYTPPVETRPMGPANYAPPYQPGAPMSLDPPGSAPRGAALPAPDDDDDVVEMPDGRLVAPSYPQQKIYPQQSYPQQQPAYQPPRQSYPQTQPAYQTPQPSYPETRPAYNPPRYQPQQQQQPARADDIPDDAILPQRRQSEPSYPRTQPAYNAPNYLNAPQTAPPTLGPQRVPVASNAMAAVTPPATLACPLVSALDRWVAQGVQPAAMKWFGSPVTEIKQISSYSCREMVGSGTSTISEHAFGNALDIAGFTLADGRKITVQNGWLGSPEEQGFLLDVQLSACDMFTTVLAPGYNVYHYNHIHVDLMRRSSGRHPCRPNAISGEVAAAQARSHYAQHHGPAYTGSIASGEHDKAPVAIPGQDGYVAEGDDVTGSIDHTSHAVRADTVRDRETTIP